MSREGRDKKKVYICHLSWFCFLVCLPFPFLHGVMTAQAVESTIWGPNSRRDIPAQDKIPIKGFFIKDAGVYVPSISPDKMMRLETFGWCQYADDDVAIIIGHEAALSSATLEQYVELVNEKSFVALKKLANNSLGTCSKLKQFVGENAAVLEIDEFLINNVRFHLYYKILRTSEGFTSCIAMCPTKDWTGKGGALRAAVNGTRLLEENESKLTSLSSLVILDAENDVFLDKKVNWEARSDRNYFKNPDKNSLDERLRAQAEKEAEMLREANRPTNWMINSLFGYELGSFIDEYASAKLCTEDYSVVCSIKAAKPFKVFTRIKLYYTKENLLLYRIQLLSDFKKNYDRSKMFANAGKIAEGVTNKFEKILTITENGREYVAKFNRDYGQSLHIRINEKVLQKLSHGNLIMGAQYEMDFVDNELKEKNVKSFRFDELQNGIKDAIRKGQQL